MKIYSIGKILGMWLVKSQITNLVMLTLVAPLYTLIGVMLYCTRRTTGLKDCIIVYSIIIKHSYSWTVLEHYLIMSNNYIM